MCSRRKDAQPGNYTSCQFVMHEHFGQTVADYLISGERTPKLNTTVRVLGRQFEHPPQNPQAFGDSCAGTPVMHAFNRSEEHTSALQSLMRISYAVFCLKKKKIEITHHHK